MSSPAFVTTGVRGPGSPELAELVPAAKFDANKLPLHLLPPDALEFVGAVLKHGAAKYGERNWEKGLSWSRCYGAALRHLFAWWMGNDRDKESGLPHLSHAACCVLFLLSYALRKTGTDDRPAHTNMEVRT